MAYAPLPQFQYPQNALLDFTPVNQGINALSSMWQNNRKVDQWEAGLQSAARMPGMRPEMMDLARSLGPEHGPNALFQVYAQGRQNEIAQQQRAMAERQFGETVRMHDQTLALQKQQEARAAEMTPYEIAIKKAQAQNSEIDTQMMRGLMGGGSAPSPSTAPDPSTIPGQAPPLPPMRGPNGASSAPAMPQGGPPNMLAPRSPLPMPGVQPQSGDGFDPSMVRPIADAPPIQPQQAAPPAERTIQTPYGDMTPERARQMAGLLALRGKNEAAKLMEKSLEQSGLGKHTQDKVGEKAFNTSELSARLDGIAAKFKPEYQTMDTQAKMYGVSWMDSIGPLRDKIPPQLREQYKAYTSYRQESIDNLSNYIKEITGAAMGVQEEKRIRMGMPDPVKDSPDQFQAKLENSLKMTKAALARHNYLISQGYDAKALGASKEKIESMVKIDDMPRIINQRGAELKQKIMSENPQADSNQVDQLIAKRIKQEFGI